MTHSLSAPAVLDLSGTPSQIGAAHGEAERERIRRYADRFLEWLLGRAAVSLSEESLWAKWAPQVAVNERLAPDLVEEMRGIARGAGVPFERVFLLNSLLDMVGFRYLEMTRSFGGCTTFAVTAEAESGRTLLGQTYDLPELNQDHLVVLRIKPADGPRRLVFSFTGMVGACGLNEAGIGVTINFLSPLDTGLGRLHSIVVRQILAAENLAEALAPPVVPPRAGGAHFLVADRDGNVASIETTAKRHAIFYPDGNAIGHTNHYLANGLKELEFIRGDSIGSSLARYTALRRYLRQQGDELDLAALQDLTRNHTSFPLSICAHGARSDPPGLRSRTVSAIVQVLDDRTMHLTNGCACESDYHTVQL